MTNEQAAAKAKKQWGDRFYIRNGKHMSSPERRAMHSSEYQETTKEIESIEEEIKRRLSELSWYQELRTRQRKLRKKANEAQSHALYHRFSVGHSNGMFTHILGSGDTWEQAFAEAERHKGL